MAWKAPLKTVEVNQPLPPTAWELPQLFASVTSAAGTIPTGANPGAKPRRTSPDRKQLPVRIGAERWLNVAFSPRRRREAPHPHIHEEKASPSFHPNRQRLTNLTASATT
jgi:hypothetical protein